MGNILDCSLGVEGGGRATHPPSVFATSAVDDELGALSESDVVDEEGSVKLQVGEISRGGSNSHRLLTSPIWGYQKGFYANEGLASFKDDTIPTFQTTNGFIAARYSRVIFDFARASSQEKVYILDVGAGTGKLGFLIIKRLLEMNEVMVKNGGRPIEFVYVLSDFCWEIIDSWVRHTPQFQHLFEQKVLDVALMDANQMENVDHIVLHYSKEKLLGKPLVCICNYLFDSLVQDCFQVHDGKLYRARVDISPENENRKGSRSTSVEIGGKKISVLWTYDFCDPREYELIAKEILPDSKTIDLTKEQQVVIDMLNHYIDLEPGHGAEGFTVMVPVGGLRLLRNLVTSRAGHDFLLLSGDKGFVDPSEFTGLEDPSITMHGSFSFMTNFHFIRGFLERICEGSHFVQSRYLDGFKILGAYLSKKKIATTVQASLDRLVHPFCPSQFSVLRKGFKEEVQDSHNLNATLAMIRLSCHDSTTFLSHRKALIDRSPTPFSSPPTQKDLMVDILGVEHMKFDFQSNKDVSFELGRIYMGLLNYTKAISLFQQSLDTCGPHHSTYLNLGISLFLNNDVESAKPMMQLALKMKPDNEQTLKWIDKIQNG